MKNHTPDKILLGTTIFLIVYGLLILASASLVKSQHLFGESYYYLKHQIIFGVLLGLGFLTLFSKINYNLFRRFSLIGFILSLILLFLLFLPKMGVKLGGARSWLELGGIVFQPAEFVKLTFLIYLSALFANKKRDVNSFGKTILSFIFLNGLLGIFFLLQPDVGSLFIIYIVSLSLLWMAGLKIRHILAIISVGLLVLLLVIYVSPYRFARIQSFLNPKEDPLGSGYQTRQALIGIGSGGIFGQGYGKSFQKTGYLPEVIGDSIFVIVVEEMGLIGGIVLIISFLIIAFRGFKISKTSTDLFASLVSGGITVMIITQAFVNITAISGLMPLTGLTLPLVSYGSSSYVATLMGIGILLNISKYTVQE
jgi:cell division protein FtsW